MDILVFANNPQTAYFSFVVVTVTFQVSKVA